MLEYKLYLKEDNDDLESDDGDLFEGNDEKDLPIDSELKKQNSSRIVKLDKA